MAGPTHADIWKRLSKISSSCRKAISNTKPSQVIDAAQPLIPSLPLHVPADFTKFLQELQLPSSTLEKLALSVQKAIDEEKAYHSKKYHDLCVNFSELNVPASSSQHTAYFDALRGTYERSFQRQLIAIQDGFLQTYEDFQLTAQSHHKKANFNADYIPLLEQYFDYNAFPSSRDREMLARRSSMTPRQIEVWFQNHRRRARNEGRPIKKASSHPLPLNLSLDRLQAHVPTFSVTKRRLSRQDSVRSNDSSEDVAEAASQTNSHPTPPQNPLETAPASRHTFPAMYRPQVLSERDAEHLTFPAPAWLRKPTTRPSNARRATLSIDNLSSLFRAKLLIISDSADARSDGTDSSQLPSAPLRPISAPHPALASSRAPSARKSPSYVPSALNPPRSSIRFGSSTSLRTHRRAHPYDASSRKRQLMPFGHPSFAPRSHARSLNPPSALLPSQRSKPSNDLPVPTHSPLANSHIMNAASDTLSSYLSSSCSPYDYAFTGSLSLSHMQQPFYTRLPSVPFVRVS